jgi:hypothetical protein
MVESSAVLGLPNDQASLYKEIPLHSVNSLFEGQFVILFTGDKGQAHMTSSYEARRDFNCSNCLQCRIPSNEKSVKLFRKSSFSQPTTDNYDFTVAVFGKVEARSPQNCRRTGKSSAAPPELQPVAKSVSTLVQLSAIALKAFSSR